MKIARFGERLGKRGFPNAEGEVTSWRGTPGRQLHCVDAKL